MTVIARYTAPMRGEEDNISSSISYECHPNVVFHEIMSQDGMLSDDEDDASEEESDDDEINVVSPSSQRLWQERPQNNVDSDVINTEISAVGCDSLGGIRGFLSRVASELSLSSVFEDTPLEESCLEDEPTQINRPRQNRLSAISMFERRAIDKGIKAGKITRTMSLNMRAGHNTPPRTSSFSFRNNRLSSFLSIDENTVEDCHNQNFQADTLLTSSQDNQNRSVAASRIGHSLLEAPLPKQKRSSTRPATVKHINKLEVPDISSMLNDLREFTSNLKAADAHAIRKQRESEFTIDTVTMTSSEDSANAASEESEEEGKQG
uniref:Uncharacterized protein n=1 Tax=Ditylum brightwellii TaxID=49249 RepID=A0A7S4W5M3_9STRA